MNKHGRELPTRTSGDQLQSPADAQRCELSGHQLESSLDAQPQHGQRPQQQQLPHGSTISLQSSSRSLFNETTLLAGQPHSDDHDRKRADSYAKRQKWLLCLWHANQCSMSQGHCKIVSDCHIVQQLWTHLRSRCRMSCEYPGCQTSRILLYHFDGCTESRCPVCITVKQKIKQLSQVSTGQTSPVRVPSAEVSIQGNIQNLGPGGELTAFTSRTAQQMVDTMTAGTSGGIRNPIAESGKSRTFSKSLADRFTPEMIHEHLRGLVNR